MAEGVYVAGMPSFQPFPGVEAKKRSSSSDGSYEPMRKMPMPKFGTRPPFEPVQFVSSGNGGNCTDEKENEKERRRSEHNGFRTREQGNSSSYRGQAYSSNSAFTYPGFHRDTSYTAWDGDRDMGASITSSLGFGGRGCPPNFTPRVDQDFSSRFDAHRHQGFSSQPHRLDEFGGGTRSAGWDVGRQGSEQRYLDRPSSSRTFSRVYGDAREGSPAPEPASIPPAVLDEKQRLITQVAAAIAVAVQDPKMSSETDGPNYNFILSRSIQACKSNPEYVYVNLKDIPLSDLPKNRKVPSEGYACELRCQRVYLATGYSGSKNGARDRASEQAVKLFQRQVEVRAVRRRYSHGYVTDIVVCQAHTATPALLPALRNPEDRVPSTSKGQPEYDRRKHWTEFVIMDNAHDSICILNNSAAFNRMKVDFRFDLLPGSSMWRCSVYLQDELVAQANGNKKMAKHAAADEAVRKLRLNQTNQQLQQQGQGQFFRGSHCSTGRKKHLSELVILENSDNAICIMNDTAQFNKVFADYKFTVLPDHRWRCDVFLEGQYVASGVGPKKTVKHIAAEEALATLRRTQAVVKSNLRKEGNADAISRSQILARTGEDSTQQEIKEDNIGNQLLRKMGWKGGGLGREGEGIAEPIRVKEQFSREGLGMEMERPGYQLNKRDIEEIIREYASSERQDDLRFSSELNNEERKHIHQVAQKYGLRSKAYAQGRRRFLVVSRKVQKEQLIGQLLQEGQVGHYELVKPQGLL